MRTLTAYGISAILVLVLLNALVWAAGSSRQHGLSAFSAGFVLGALGMYIAAWLYGYQKVGAR
jgi:hypothetical protein